MERLATPNVIEQMEKADRIKKTDDELKAMEELNRKLYHLAERFCNFGEESERLTAFEKVVVALNVVLARAEKAESACAEMRKVLVACDNHFAGASQAPSRAVIKDALSSDCGKDWAVNSGGAGRGYCPQEKKI